MRCLLKFCSIVYFVLLVHIFVPQDHTYAQENQIHAPQFFMDLATFKNLASADSPYVEIYCSFFKNQLKHFLKDKKWLGLYELDFVLLDSSGKSIARQSIQGISMVDSLAECEQQMVVDVAAFLVPSGRWFVRTTLKDLLTQKKSTAEMEFSVPNYRSKNIKLSDIQLARSIRKATKESKFVKNGIEAIPYPSQIYGIESPFLFAYAEIYGLQPGKTVIKEVSILDGESVIAYNRRRKEKVKHVNTIWVEKLNVLKFSAGSYLLRFTLMDSTGNVLTKRLHRFWMYSPQKSMISEPQDTVSNERISQFRSQIYYLVDRKELDFFDGMSSKEKASYMANFWKRYSPEFRREHLKRFFSAQKHFSTPTLPGWKTDRGRVFIQYGPPDEIISEPASLDTRAYEIWIYETLRQQNRVLFVFCDYGVSGNYQLIHCTLKSGKRAEIYNPNWREEIKISR